MLLGVYSFCCLPCIICLADYKNQIFHFVGPQSSANNYHLPVESNGRNFLWLDRALLRQPGANGGYMGLPLQQHPGIPVIKN